MVRTLPFGRRTTVCAALALAIVMANVPLRAFAAPGDITTVAGSGNFAAQPSGNGGPPTSADMIQPYGVATAPGKLFVGEHGYDTTTSQVRVVQNGVINAFAGGALPPLNDGAPATQAPLGPTSVVTDTAGNLYIADEGRDRVREVSSATGIITTVAGATVCGTSVFSCNGGYSGDGGPATQALLADPRSVALDSAGNLYISTVGDHDSVNGTGYGYVRRVDAATGIITTVAGGGHPADDVGDNGPATSAKLQSPDAIAVDGAGNIFIVDSDKQLVRRVDATTGIITTVAGDGANGFNGDGIPATSAQLSNPIDVSVDTGGDIFIADEFNCRIRKVDTAGMISSVAGTTNYPCSAASAGDGGQATAATLGFVAAVHVDAAGELFIEDGGEGIRKVDTHGVISAFAGTGHSGYLGDGGPALTATVGGHLHTDAAGNLFIADEGNGRIRKVDTNGIVTTVAGGGVGDGIQATLAQLNGPRGLAVDASGNLYIADCGDSRVRKVDSSGVITSVAGAAAANNGLGDGGQATSAALACPAALAFGGGALYVADATGNRVRRVDSSGVITTVAGNGTAGFSGDGGPATAAEMSAPSGLAVDGSGNLYISDLNNNRVRKVDTSGTITTYAGNGGSGGGVDGVAATKSPITWPEGLAVGPGGVLTIAESGFARVREVNPQGIISTVAGNGIPGYSGDGGQGPFATLDSPTTVAYDSSGNLLVADDNNGVIRSVAAGAPPPPPPVTKKTADCGMTITQNLTLASDIGPCPGDGVIIGADGVHLNLNGHTISGTFSHTGNTVGVRLQGRQKVKISGGTVTGFDAGIAIIDGSGNTVTGLTIANNTGDQANTFSSTFGDGVVMFASAGNTVAGNAVLGNGPFDGIGMIGFGADNNLIQNNTIKDTPNANRPFYPGLGIGIVTNPFLGFDRPRQVSLFNNQIVGNVVKNNASAGISTISNTGGVIRSNIVEHNGFGSPFGFAYPGNGIGVTHVLRADPHTNAIVENNQVIGNASDGLDVSGLGNQIMNNVGDGNGGRFAHRFRFDFLDENRDPTTGVRDCYSDTWSGNQWGSGGFSPACVSNGGSALPDGTSLPVAPEGPIPQGLGDPPPRVAPN